MKSLAAIDYLRLIAAGDLAPLDSEEMSHERRSVAQRAAGREGLRRGHRLTFIAPDR